MRQKLIQFNLKQKHVRIDETKNKSSCHHNLPPKSILPRSKTNTEQTDTSHMVQEEEYPYTQDIHFEEVSPANDDNDDDFMEFLYAIPDEKVQPRISSTKGSLSQSPVPQEQVLG